MVAADYARETMTDPLRDFLLARLWDGDIYYDGNIEGIDIYRVLRREWIDEDRPDETLPVQPGDTDTPVV